MCSMYNLQAPSIWPSSWFGPLDLLLEISQGQQEVVRQDLRRCEENGTCASQESDVKRDAGRKRIQEKMSRKKNVLRIHEKEIW